MDLPGELIKQSSGVLTKAYDDLVHPSAEPAGAVLSLIPRTIRLWLKAWEKWVANGEEGLEKTAEALRGKVDSIPEERLREPEPYIAIPAIQQIAYCFDSSELREMYANLLATSMDSATSEYVHPSFVEIIRQLTPDEARLLRELPRSVTEYEPLGDYVLELSSRGTMQTLLTNVSSFGRDVVQHLDRIPEYLENLIRLRIIESRPDVIIRDDSFYQDFPTDDEILDKAGVTLKDGLKLHLMCKSFNVTNYGLSFIRCCVDDFASRADEG